MIKEAIALLGLHAKDKVTGYEGCIISVFFDLPGCVQVGVAPKSVDGKRSIAEFFDVNRLEIDYTKRYMDTPTFDLPVLIEGEAVHLDVSGVVDNVGVAHDPTKHPKGPAEISDHRETPLMG